MQIKHIFFTLTSLSSVPFFIPCWQELIGVDNLCGLNGLWADTKKYHGWYIMKLIAVMSCEPSNYLCSASFPLFLCIIPFVKTLSLQPTKEGYELNVRKLGSSCVFQGGGGGRTSSMKSDYWLAVTLLISYFQKGEASNTIPENESKISNI